MQPIQVIGYGESMAPKASTSNLGVLSVINESAAAIDGLQKVRIADVTRAHQIDMAAQQWFECVRQLGPTFGTRTWGLLVWRHQKVKAISSNAVDFRGRHHAAPPASTSAQQLGVSYKVILLRDKPVP